MATLIMTAKLNDVDPQAWLSDGLARINGYPARALEISYPGTGKPLRPVSLPPRSTASWITPLYPRSSPDAFFPPVDALFAFHPEQKLHSQGAC